jgi:hypothetical protein
LFSDKEKFPDRRLNTGYHDVGRRVATSAVATNIGEVRLREYFTELCQSIGACEPSRRVHAISAHPDQRLLGAGRG